jgi:hypothetical protein
MKERGGALRVEHKSMAGMGGAHVYASNRWLGWFGGI